MQGSCAILPFHALKMLVWHRRLCAFFFKAHNQWKRTNVDLERGTCYAARHSKAKALASIQKNFGAKSCQKVRYKLKKMEDASLIVDPLHDKENKVKQNARLASQRSPQKETAEKRRRVSFAHSHHVTYFVNSAPSVAVSPAKVRTSLSNNTNKAPANSNKPALQASPSILKTKPTTAPAATIATQIQQQPAEEQQDDEDDDDFSEDEDPFTPITPVNPIQVFEDAAAQDLDDDSDDFDDDEDDMAEESREEQNMEFTETFGSIVCTQNVAIPLDSKQIEQDMQDDDDDMQMTTDVGKIIATYEANAHQIKPNRRSSARLAQMNELAQLQQEEEEDNTVDGMLHELNSSHNTTFSIHSDIDDRDELLGQMEQQAQEQPVQPKEDEEDKQAPIVQMNNSVLNQSLQIAANNTSMLDEPMEMTNVFGRISTIERPPSPAPIQKIRQDIRRISTVQPPVIDEEDLTTGSLNLSVNMELTRSVGHILDLQDIPKTPSKKLEELRKLAGLDYTAASPAVSLHQPLTPATVEKVRPIQPISFKEFVQLSNIRFYDADLDDCARRPSLGAALKPAVEPESVADFLRLGCVVATEQKHYEILSDKISKHNEQLLLTMNKVEERLDQLNPPIFKFMQQQADKEKIELVQKKLARLKYLCNLQAKLSLHKLKLEAEHKIQASVSEETALIARDSLITSKFVDHIGYLKSELDMEERAANEYVLHKYFFFLT